MSFTLTILALSVNMILRVLTYELYYTGSIYFKLGGCLNMFQWLIGNVNGNGNFCCNDDREIERYRERDRHTNRQRERERG